MKYTINFKQAQALSVFYDIYLKMLEDGLWFDENGERIEEVKEGIWTEDLEEYKWATAFAASYDFFEANREYLGNFEIFELNDYVDKADEIKKSVFEAIVRELYAEELEGGKSFDKVADRLEFWESPNGQVLIESSGVKPLEGTKKLGYVDNGQFWVE